MTQRLSIKHLQVLAAFRRSGSLSKIAEFLKLTPSAVSRRIDEAESRLGLALFAKASNRVRLTPAGEYILQAAERILADLDRVESVAARLGSDVHHVIRIGMSIYRSFAWFPDFSAYLAQAKPGIRLELAAEDKDELEALKGHGVDIVMTPLVDDFPGTSRVELFDDDLVALVAPSHRLAKRRFMRPEDVAPEDFYTYSLAVRPGFEYLEYLLPAHAAPHRYIVVAAPGSRRGLGPRRPGIDDPQQMGRAGRSGRWPPDRASLGRAGLENRLGGAAAGDGREGDRGIRCRAALAKLLRAAAATRSQASGRPGPQAARLSLRRNSTRI